MCKNVNLMACGESRMRVWIRSTKNSTFYKELDNCAPDNTRFVLEICLLLGVIVKYKEEMHNYPHP